MSDLAFTVPGKPLPWKRAGDNRGQRYTPADQRAYQDRVRWSAIAALGPRRARWDSTACFVVELVAYVPDRRRRDVDNFQKQIGDSLNRILWDDDSQIVMWKDPRKLLDRANPRIEVAVWAVPDPMVETLAIIEGEVGR